MAVVCGLWRGHFGTLRTSHCIDISVTFLYCLGMTSDDHLVTMRYWQDEDGQGWIVLTRWAPVNGQEECVGLEVRSWCEDVMEAFSTQDHRALGLIGADPRRLSWQHLRRMPLPLLLATQRDQELWSPHKELARSRAKRWASEGPRTAGVWSRLTVEQWQRVADVARSAKHEGAPKSRAVALALGITDPTKRDLARMRKLIQRAREKGYITSTEQEGS